MADRARQVRLEFALRIRLTTTGDGRAIELGRQAEGALREALRNLPNQVSVEGCRIVGYAGVDLKSVEEPHQARDAHSGLAGARL